MGKPKQSRQRQHYLRDTSHHLTQPLLAINIEKTLLRRVQLACKPSKWESMCNITSILQKTEIGPLQRVQPCQTLNESLCVKHGQHSSRKGSKTVPREIKTHFLGELDAKADMWYDMASSRHRPSHGSSFEDKKQTSKHDRRGKHGFSNQASGSENDVFSRSHRACKSEKVEDFVSTRHRT